jgi:VanZ family protein
MMTGLKRPASFWTIFLIWVVLIGFLSLTPIVDVNLEKGRDKIIHFLFYLPFGFLGYYHPRQGWRNFILVPLFGLNLGLLLELIQRKIPHRVCDKFDFLADALAVLTGLLLLGIWSIYKNRRLKCRN